jgi:hypothetical protein
MHLRPYNSKLPLKVELKTSSSCNDVILKNSFYLIKKRLLKQIERLEFFYERTKHSFKILSKKRNKIKAQMIDPVACTINVLLW